MQHNVKTEIEEIAVLTGKTVREVAEELQAQIHGEEIIVWNRSSEAKVSRTLTELKEEKRAAEIRKERLASFHWVRINGEWRVAGDFSQIEEGDTITVIKASGQKQEKVVVAISDDRKTAQVK